MMIKINERQEVLSVVLIRLKVFEQRRLGEHQESLHQSSAEDLFRDRVELQGSIEGHVRDIRASSVVALDLLKSLDQACGDTEANIGSPLVAQKGEPQQVEMGFSECAEDTGIDQADEFRDRKSVV